MGQAATKERHHHHHNNYDAGEGSSSSAIAGSGGSGSGSGGGGTGGSGAAARRKNYPVSVDGGALEPQGVYTGPQDYSQDVVKTAIVRRKLMPFFTGMDDEESYADREYNSECPICFLYYPSVLNRTRCCGQPICTECFVQMKRADPNHTKPPSSQPTECPFCTETNFGVLYEKPQPKSGDARSASIGQEGGSAIAQGSDEEDAAASPPLTSQQKRKSFSHTDPDVLTTDMIRPDWQEKLSQAQAAILRRANRRIIMRQVGERLIPVGVSSSRAGSELPEGSGPGGAIILREGEQWGPFTPTGVDPSSHGRRSSRRQLQVGSDVEDLMMEEAMRLSLIEHEEEQRRQRAAAASVEQQNQQSQSQPQRQQQKNSSSSSTDQGLVRRSSSTSRGQRLSPPTRIAERLSKELRNASLHDNNHGEAQATSSSASAPLRAPSSSMPPPAPAVNFGLQDDVMTDLAELIDEPNDEMKQRIEVSKRAREDQERTAAQRAAAAEESIQEQNEPETSGQTQQQQQQQQQQEASASGLSPASPPSLGLPPPVQTSTEASSSSSTAGRPLNPNNPFRARMASSGAPQ
ncbi:unnamed protein product [Jaminaea pallidilutea]